MPDVGIVPARASHIKPIASALGYWDRIEAEAFSSTPREAVRRGYAGSTHCWTGTIDGVPHAMWGCTPVSPWEANVWMLGTGASRAHARAFLVVGGASIADMLQMYDRLSNWIAVGNRLGRRMLARWGFHEADTPIRIGDHDFVRFWIDRTDI